MMSPSFLLLVPLLAVSFGYEPSSDSDTGYDYTVQVEPELVEQMQRGNAEAIEVNIPPEITPIRRIRVVVGNESLPKRLRAQGSVEQITYRQDIDAPASPSIDLLAQTGPAGGFGRNSTGFNAAATRGSAPPPSSTPTTIPTGPNTVPTTVPPMGTQYRTPTTDIRGQLDAGFQAVENGVNTATGAFGDTINSVGASGQQFIDSTRQALNDIVAPPDSLNRSAGSAASAFDNDRYAANTTGEQRQATEPAPRWNSENPDQFTQQERSVLTQTQQSPPQQQQPQPQQNNAGLTQAERDYLDRIERDRQQMQRQQATQQPTTNFPQQPPLQPLPDRNQQDVVVSLGNRPRADNTFGAMPPMGTAPGQNSAGPALASPQTGDTNWMFTQTADRQNTPSIDTPAITSAPPQITTSGPAITQQGGNNDVASWLESQQNGGGQASDNQPQQSSTPVWLLGWTIAIGSVATNLFQWLNIVDMRNKYRVALRRSSPNFSRSMAA